MHFIFHPFGKDVSILAHVPMHYSLLPSFQHTALPALCGLCPKGSGQSILQTVDSSTPVGYTVKNMRLIFYDMLSKTYYLCILFFTIHNIAIFVCFPITFHKGFAILPLQHKHNLRKNHATFLSSISRLKNNSDEFHLARPTATFSAHVDLHNLGNIPFLDCNFQN